MVMDILRRVAVALLVAILPLLLLALAVDYWVINAVSHPATPKRIIADSGIYTNLVPSALKQASESNNENVVSLVDPTVKSAATQVFTPQFLQQSTENVLDGIYHWLNGKAARPDFKIDLSSKKSEFAALVADHARQIAAGLPRCTVAQAQALAQQQVQGSNFDVFKANCLPPGVTPDNAADQVQKELQDNKDFLKDPVITANNLTSGDSRQPFFETPTAKRIPKYYQWATKTPVILSILTVLVITGIIFLSSSRRRGARHIGVILLVVGAILLVAAYGLGQIKPDKLIVNNSNQGITNPVLMQDMRNIAKDFLDLLKNNSWFFGGLYAALGTAAVALAWKYPRRKSGEPPLAPESASPEHPQQVPAKRAGSKNSKKIGS